MGIDPISIGVMAAGTLLSAGGQAFAGFAQQNEIKARQRMADVEAQNQRLEQVRQARIQHARIIQAGENQGAGGSSSVVAGAQGATGQAEAGIQYINDQQSINHAIVSAQSDQVTGRGLATLGQGITELGGTVFAHAPYISQKAHDIFGLDIPVS